MSVLCLSDIVRTHHVTRHNTPMHKILSTAHQLSISQKALGTLPEDGNLMPKHVGATIHRPTQYFREFEYTAQTVSATNLRR
jgi:hypothetical protein